MIGIWPRYGVTIMVNILLIFLLIQRTMALSKQKNLNQPSSQIRNKQMAGLQKYNKKGVKESTNYKPHNYNDDKDDEDSNFTINIIMNGDETEKYYLDLDTFFPYNNFTIINVTLNGEYPHPDYLPQQVNFYPQDPIVVEQIIDISITNNASADQSKDGEDPQTQCPKQGINIIASKAPEDQPAHIFLSSDNNLYVIIFDDTQKPVQKIANYNRNLNDYVQENEKLFCMDIEVYDSDAVYGYSFQRDNNKGYQNNDDGDDTNDCFVFVDCNIIIPGQEDQQNFAMIFVPLQKDSNDIIKSIGDITVKRYTLNNPIASNYFYTCPRRVIDNYSTVLIMYCPSNYNSQQVVESNLIFMKNLQNGGYFPNTDDIIFISSTQLQSSNCASLDQNLLIKSLVSNPLYEKPSDTKIEDIGWQFSLLLSDRICKCKLGEIGQQIICSSIQLSDQTYHQMVYIQEESILTLFVGSDSSIDEIQVGESINEDGQSLIVGSLAIEEKDLVLQKITVNSEYIIAQMKNTSINGVGEIDIVVKVFSRTNENSFLHFYEKLQSPIQLFQNDNFYDMGNYVMIYLPAICTLHVTRVTQKPLIISTTKIQDINIQKIYSLPYIIHGNYSILNELQEFDIKQKKANLTLQLIPFSMSVLNPVPTSMQTTTWQQQIIDLSIKFGVTGSLLYFMYEPSVQDDKFQSLIDYNQTIFSRGNFFDNKTIFMLELNDTKKLYNPNNYRAVVSDYATPCIVSQYFCTIHNLNGFYFTEDDCQFNSKIDLTQYLKQGTLCKIDSYSESGDQIFLADKQERIAFACNAYYSKFDEETDIECFQILGDFVTNLFLVDSQGVYQGYNTVNFFLQIGEASILITVTEDKKKVILFQLNEYCVNDVLTYYCSEIFLIVDKSKLSSLVDGTILQMDSFFIENDYIFLLTSDLKIYVLTRIQQLYQQNQNRLCSEVTEDICIGGNYKYSKDNNHDVILNTDRLVHVSAMIDLTQNQASLDQSCKNTSFQQMFTLYGVDPNTISLVVLCYDEENFLMQEFEFQNPFTYNWTRMFPFFNYLVDSEAPHFTDRYIVYISTHYELRIGTMKAYLLYSIQDFTPNSAAFEVVTCYPTQNSQSLFSNDCSTNSNNKDNSKKPHPPAPFTYYQFSEMYGSNYAPQILGIPFKNSGQKTITLALFSFSNITVINYLNFWPQLYASANLGASVVVPLNLNMIISKINLRDIHFNSYTIQFDLSDSEIIINDTDQDITLSNTSIEPSLYTLNYQLPINNLSGPIESYQVQMYKNGNIVSVNNQVADYNSFFGDYLLLEKYYFSYLDTYFTYGTVQDILSFSSFYFSPNPTQKAEESCEDCSNLIAIISTNYLLLIEREQYSLLSEVNPVTKVVFKIDLPSLDKNYQSIQDGSCRMTLNSNSQILVYCVSSQKSTIFKLYEVTYSKLDPDSTTVKSRMISSTGGYIGYVDQIIPFEFNGQVYLVIKTHYILNQQMSIFKIAVVDCSSAQNGNDCSLIVKQTFPTTKFQLSDTYVVDYEIQLLIHQDTNLQEIIGIFISNTTINIFFFENLDDTFDVTKTITIFKDQIKDATNTKYYFDLIFLKLLNILSTDSFSFLLGTNLDMYEMSYNNGILKNLYTYGKYYQCEHTPGIKPTIFNMNGVPFNRKTNFYILTTPDNTDYTNFSIQSVLSSCSRTPSSQKPVFDPDPAIFSQEATSMYYIQFFIKNQTDKSWPVRILTYPYSAKISPYIFEGFTNSLNESRIIVSNFSYFLVEHQVQFNLNLNLSLSDKSADMLVVSLVNGFTSKQMNFTLNFHDSSQKEKNQVWFIVLIVVISVIAIFALIFIVIWIKKQRNIKNEKKNERMIQSGMTDLSDHKSEHPINENNVLRHNPPTTSKFFQPTNQYHQIQQNQQEGQTRQSEMFQLVESKKSEKYTRRISIQVDNLLRSVSQLRERRKDIDPNDIINEKYENLS